MAAIGKDYSDPKALRMHLERIEKHPPMRWPVPELVTYLLEPIETSAELLAYLKTRENNE